MDAVIQGLVVGAVFAALGLVVALFRSKTEVARRIKVVLGVVAGGVVVLAAYDLAKLPGVLILAGITAAAVYIFRGHKAG